jgi:hypothetical protein
MSEPAEGRPLRGGPFPVGERERKPPRWVTPFLRALERTGVVRAAADDAGVDHTTAYVRRRTHPEFAAAWAEAKKAHKAVNKYGDDDPSTSASSGNGSPSHPSGREELIVSGNRLKRVSSERWGKRKEEAFLAELAVTGTFQIACKAVGISCEAVRKRRRKDPRLEAACKAAIAECAKRAPEFLAGAMVATFDPQAVLDAEPGGLPRVSIDQAIKIAQMKLPPGVEAEIALPDIEEVRERLEKTMRALNLIPDEAQACPHCGRTPDEAEQAGEE